MDIFNSIEIFMREYLILGILLSVLVNVILSFLPIPSFPITAVNITVYGILGGFFVSLLGEAVAAVVSFYVFRMGLQEISRSKLTNYKKFMRLIDADQKEGFKLVLTFRMFPYIPSGIITYFASIGKMNIVPFAISSTIGKIPAMIIEVLLVYYTLQLPLKQILALVSAIIIIVLIKNIYKKNN